MRDYTSLALVLVLTACAGAPKRNDPTVLKAVREAEAAHLSGTVSDLGASQLLEDRDFVYAIAVSPDGTAAAYTHLGAHHSELAIYTLGGETPERRANLEVNPYEFDLEAVEFSPDGASVAVVSRDGAVRLYDAKTGAAKGGYATEEPLVSLAFHPSGKYLAVGSARGLVTIVRVPELTYVSELRAHRDEVRGLAFDRSGRLYSAGWDKTLVRLDGAERPLDTGSARVRYEREGESAVVRANVNGQAAGAVVFDRRTAVNLISSSLLKTAGVDPFTLSDTVTVQTALGSTEAKLARGVKVRFKALALEQDFAVCDGCLPKKVQAVLGAPFLERVEVRFDQTTQEALLELTVAHAERGPAAHAEPGRSVTPSHSARAAPDRTVTSAPTGWVLAIGARREYPHFLNDVTVDAAGARLAVAFSEIKAQRTREIYEREKKGVEEKRSEGNAPALIDAKTLEVLTRFPGHRGVVATAAISPDGRTVASGGWDRTVRVQTEGRTDALTRRFGWSVRRVRFSRDGVVLAIGAWTPQNAVGDRRSDPAAILHEVIYETPEVVSQ